MRTISPTRSALALALLLATAAAQADSQPAAEPVALRGDISGSWYDPQQSGQGLMLEVLDGGRAALSWYTFDADGNPLWLAGAGTVRGRSVVAEMITTEGGRFPPEHDASQLQSQPWGEVEIEFTGCSAGILHWDPVAPGFNAGSMPLARLTAISGTRCNVEETFSETRNFSFERGSLGFEAVFADYPPEQAEDFQLDYAYERLPAPLDARRGVRLSGMNRSDDLVMMVKYPLGGLRPEVLYEVELEMEIASNEPHGCIGVGGSPGEAVALKLGASTIEPLALRQDPQDANVRLNIDFGSQSEGGADAHVVGNLATSQPCDPDIGTQWELKTVSTIGQPLRVRTDGDGVLWVYGGSDSGYESRSDWYLTAFRVRLDPVDESGHQD